MLYRESNKQRRAGRAARNGAAGVIRREAGH